MAPQSLEYYKENYRNKRAAELYALTNVGDGIPESCIMCPRPVKVVNTFDYKTQDKRFYLDVRNHYYEVECDYGHNFYTG